MTRSFSVNRPVGYGRAPILLCTLGSSAIFRERTVTWRHLDRGMQIYRLQESSTSMQKSNAEEVKSCIITRMCKEKIVGMISSIIVL